MCGLALSVETTESLHRLCQKAHYGPFVGGFPLCWGWGKCPFAYLSLLTRGFGLGKRGRLLGVGSPCLLQGAGRVLGGLPDVAAGSALACLGGSLHAKHPLGRGLRVASGSDGTHSAA